MFSHHILVLSLNEVFIFITTIVTTFNFLLLLFSTCFLSLQVDPTFLQIFSLSYNVVGNHFSPQKNSFPRSLSLSRFEQQFVAFPLPLLQNGAPHPSHKNRFHFLHRIIHPNPNPSKIIQPMPKTATALA